MRHVLIAGLVAAVLTVPLCAQMRGGHGGSSGHSSFSPGGSGFGSSGRSFSQSGARFSGGSAHHFGNGFHRGFGDGFHGGFRGGFHSHFRSGFTVVGAFGYPYYGIYGSFGYPWYGGYPAYSYPAYAYPAYSYPEQNSGYTSDLDYSYQQKRNMEELERLQDRVDRLEQRASASVPRPPQYEAQTKSSTPVILIFRDKHSQEVNNYAVVGETLWIFNEQRATRIPLSKLDLDATRKANDDRGVEFQVPPSH